MAYLWQTDEIDLDLLISRLGKSANKHFPKFLECSLKRCDWFSSGFERMAGEHFNHIFYYAIFKSPPPPPPSARLHFLPPPLPIYVHYRQKQTQLGVCEWGTSDSFHMAASLIALFTAKDNCSMVQWRIIRLMLCCTCAIWVICLAEKTTAPQLFTCGASKASHRHKEIGENCMRPSLQPR